MWGEEGSSCPDRSVLKQAESDVKGMGTRE